MRSSPSEASQQDCGPGPTCVRMCVRTCVLMARAVLGCVACSHRPLPPPRHLLLHDAPHDRHERPPSARPLPFRRLVQFCRLLCHVRIAHRARPAHVARHAPAHRGTPRHAPARFHAPPPPSSRHRHHRTVVARSIRQVLIRFALLRRALDMRVVLGQRTLRVVPRDACVLARHWRPVGVHTAHGDRTRHCQSVGTQCEPVLSGRLVGRRVQRVRAGLLWADVCAVHVRRGRHMQRRRQRRRIVRMPDGACHTLLFACATRSCLHARLRRMRVPVAPRTPMRVQSLLVRVRPARASCPSRPQGWSGTLCDACSVDYWGPSCTACACLGNSTCDAGINGTGCECDAGHFGVACAACPCVGSAQCNEGIGGSGSCTCLEGFTNVATGCDACASGRYGSSCEPCDCPSNTACAEGISGSGRCNCNQPSCEMDASLAFLELIATVDAYGACRGDRPPMCGSTGRDRKRHTLRCCVGCVLE
jgi:hypothetical protein